MALNRAYLLAAVECQLSGLLCRCFALLLLYPSSVGVYNS